MDHKPFILAQFRRKSIMTRIRFIFLNKKELQEDNAFFIFIILLSNISSKEFFENRTKCLFIHSMSMESSLKKSF